MQIDSGSPGTRLCSATPAPLAILIPRTVRPWGHLNRLIAPGTRAQLLGVALGDLSTTMM